MRRRLLNYMSLLSLVLLVATVVLWVASYRYVPEFSVSGQDLFVSVGAERGTLVVERITWLSGPASPRGVSLGYSDVSPTQAVSMPSDTGIQRDWHALGFEWVVSNGGAAPPVTIGTTTMVFFSPPKEYIGVPLWFLAVLLSGLLYRLRRTRELDRLRAGLCVRCGYDLRATPERCPECGREVRNSPEHRQSGWDGRGD